MLRVIVQGGYYHNFHIQCVIIQKKDFLYKNNEEKIFRSFFENPLSPVKEDNRPPECYRAFRQFFIVVWIPGKFIDDIHQNKLH
jgi:hypothetical protein